MEILALFFAMLALATVFTLIAFRLLTRWCGTWHLIEDGVALTDDGIEYLRLYLLGKDTARFDEIESVEFLPYWKAQFPILLCRYGFSLHIIRTRFFGDCVLVGLRKSPKWFELYFKYLLFTPKDPAEFVYRLKERLKECKSRRPDAAV